MVDDIPASKPHPAPALFRAMRRFNDFLAMDFPGGPRFIKAAWVINLQKGGTLLFVLGLMFYFDHWSTAAWVYLGMHGSYGIVWLLKDMIFPDPSWQKRVTVGGAVNMWLFALGLYWIAPVLLISDLLPTRPDPPLWLLGTAVVVYAVGVMVMIAADCQKFYTLKYKWGLITEGMFGRTRNPNYLGEMMIYGAFASIVMHWLPWVVLAWVWGALFLTNMVNKDASLSRHPGWSEYKARSWLLFPKPW